MLAFWIVAPIVLYIIVIGALVGPLQKSIIRRCTRCSIHNGHSYHVNGYEKKRSEDVHDYASAVALFWPLALPYLLGRWISELPQHRVSRAERRALAASRRRDEELEEQRHQNKLARLRAEENAMLDKQLAKESGDRSSL